MVPAVEVLTPAMDAPVDVPAEAPPAQPEVAPPVDMAPVEAAPPPPPPPQCPASCPEQANATASCSPTKTCVWSCKPGFLTCSAGACVSRAHAFEGGDLEGVHVNAAVTSNYSRALRGPIQIRPFQGGHWLAADVHFTPDIAAISFIVPICPAASTTGLRGKSFNAKLWAEGPPLSNGSALSAAASIPIGFLIAARSPVAQGAEIVVPGKFPDIEESDKVVEVEIGITVRDTTTLAPWDGTIYLDEIVVGD
jgi:hypothetical protein